MRWLCMVLSCLVVFTAGWVSSVSSKVKQLETSLHFVAGPDFAHMNTFFDTVYKKTIEMHNQTVDLMDSGAGPQELAEIRDAMEKLHQRMFQENAEFREAAAGPTASAALQKYYEQAWASVKELTALSEKLDAYKKLHPK